MKAKKPAKRPRPPGKLAQPTPPAKEEAAEPAPAETPDSGAARFPVVGIGASAGGLDAFKKFFAAMPADSGIAFILIPHLDPTHESLMVELLARHTHMPVVEAQEGMAVEPNRVYIIPPNKYMTSSGGVLRLTGPVARRGLTAIDLFLRSLADDLQERAICIILSGTGAHGTLGLKAIKANGGMAMVQDPKTAEFDHMPHSAVASGLADYVLPPEQMPYHLIQYVRHFYVNGGQPGEAGAEAPDQFNQLLALLRARTRYDFRCYRKNMLARRVNRRMGLHQMSDVKEYLAFLREDPAEVKRLTRDLFISVTSFFRDPEAFRALETEVAASLCQRSEEVLRVWVPGCATGEEAYSVAMLFLEQLTASHKACRLQVFATDVDEQALDTARQGVYPEGSVGDLSPERLTRFFVKVDEHTYRVNKQLREAVVFAVQNLIHDPPFTKLDLVCCRNLLIYLEPDVQQKVVTLLHFALNEGGFLFLGPSETIGRQVELFEPVSKKWRIYRRIGRSRPERVSFPIEAAEQPRPRQLAEKPPLSFADLMKELLLEEHAPAAVLIDRKGEVVCYFGPTSRYLELPAGEPTQDVLQLAREGLRSKLRAGIHKAVREKERVVVGNIQLKRGSASYPVRTTIRPIQAPHAAEGLLLLTFEDVPAPLPARPTATEGGQEALVQQLEYELKANREDLQNTIEEMESSNEELKASNEEVMSMNEELQSSNEELETSKEELQSLNEELATVNSQLQEKVQELESANNDMANLLHCTDVAVVFLDTSLRIKRFTPAATRLLNLIATDLGRPVGDLAPKFADPELLGDAEQVLRHLTPREKEVRTQAGEWCLRRINPYRSADNRIEGVVVTFVDVTRLRQAAEEAQRLATVLKDSNDAVTVRDLDGQILAWNRGAQRMYGWTEAEALQMNFDQIVPEEHGDQLREMTRRVRRGEQLASFETHRRAKDGALIDVWATVTALRDDSGNVVAIATTERDITERKRLENELRSSQQRLAGLITNAADAIITIDDKGHILSVNAATEQMFGYHVGELVAQNVKMLMPSPYREQHDSYLANYLRSGVKKIIGIGRMVRGRRKDGSTFPVDLAVSEYQNHTDRFFIGILRDISKELEHEMLEVMTREQRRIGQELHDHVGQELTATGLLAEGMAERLHEHDPSAAGIAAKIREGVQRSLNRVRDVARGLISVEVDPQGLMAALSDLAARASEHSKVACSFECPAPVLVHDNATATHLYHIAQEAVTNTLKHARAKRLAIRLSADERSITLQVEDDGRGIRHRLGGAKEPGLGLRIMRYRAELIRGQLTVEQPKDGGTRVTCTIPRDDTHEQEAETTR